MREGCAIAKGFGVADLCRSVADLLPKKVSALARAFPKSDLLKVLSVVATIPACFLIFSGGFVLAKLAVAYTARDLILFGGFPLVGGVCWLMLAAWFWSRAIGSKSLWDSIGLVSLRALGAVALAVAGAMALGKWHSH